MINIYTDGSSNYHTGCGGWAAVIFLGKTQLEIFGGAKDTTNNRMEMTAALKGLRLIKHTTHTINLITDSEYLQKGATQWINKWRGLGYLEPDNHEEMIKNPDLWRMIDHQNTQQDIIWQWVRGHSGNQWNERADHLAGEARKRMEQRL